MRRLPGSPDDRDERRRHGHDRLCPNAVLSHAEQIVRLVREEDTPLFPDRRLRRCSTDAQLLHGLCTDDAARHADSDAGLRRCRLNDMDLGSIEGIPRILDCGQCNDAYSAIRIALALAEAFGCGVNDLPLTLVLSWYEQKAVCILLTLLHLGLRNIYLGPTLPAFVSPNVLDFLVKQYNLTHGRPENRFGKDTEPTITTSAVQRRLSARRMLWFWLLQVNGRLHLHQLIRLRADAKGLGGINGVGAVAAVDALHKVVAAGVVAVHDQIDAGAVQCDGVKAREDAHVVHAGSSATAQQSQSTERFFMTAT